MSTKLTKYPCPICGKYYLPKQNLKGKALMICDEHGMFETSIKRSLSFRKLSSIAGSKPNRSQGYYTKGEKKIRQYLITKLRMREGIDFIHNCRMRHGKRIYWIDFYIPKINLALEYSPKVWHKLWNREKSDKRKKEFLEENDIKLISLKDKDIDNLPEIECLRGINI